MPQVVGAAQGYLKELVGYVPDELRSLHSPQTARHCPGVATRCIESQKAGGCSAVIVSDMLRFPLFHS